MSSNFFSSRLVKALITLLIFPFEQFSLWPSMHWRWCVCALVLNFLFVWKDSIALLLFYYHLMFLDVFSAITQTPSRTRMFLRSKTLIVKLFAVTKTSALFKSPTQQAHISSLRCRDSTSPKDMLSCWSTGINHQSHLTSSCSSQERLISLDFHVSCLKLLVLLHHWPSYWLFFLPSVTLRQSLDELIPIYKLIKEVKGEFIILFLVECQCRRRVGGLFESSPCTSNTMKGVIHAFLPLFSRRIYDTWCSSSHSMFNGNLIMTTLMTSTLRRTRCTHDSNWK